MAKRDADLLGRLGDLDRAQLVAAWRDLYGCPPPKNAGQRFLRLAIAHRLQSRIHGGLKQSTRDRLLRIAEAEAMTGTVPPELLTPRPTVKPGTRFIREWRGEVHEVTVVADGRFEWRGDRYPSLSVIARTITGTRRNGPAFFGLRQGEAHAG